ncbi:MAG TPA: hypothetical protein H9673_08420 [Candidatus Adamsella sp.]|nr:hypothetical protein [Candidatus Adamsella sp.]
MNINRINQTPSFGNYFTVWDFERSKNEKPTYLDTSIIKKVENNRNRSSDGYTTLTVEGGQGKLFKINIMESIKEIMPFLCEHKDSKNVMTFTEDYNDKEDSIYDVVDSFKKL